MTISTSHTGCGVRTPAEKKMCHILQRATFQRQKFTRVWSITILKTISKWQPRRLVKDLHTCGKTKATSADTKNANYVPSDSHQANFPNTDSLLHMWRPMKYAQQGRMPSQDTMKTYANVTRPDTKPFAPKFMLRQSKKERLLLPSTPAPAPRFNTDGLYSFQLRRLIQQEYKEQAIRDIQRPLMDASLCIAHAVSRIQVTEVSALRTYQRTRVTAFASFAALLAIRFAAEKGHTASVATILHYRMIHELCRTNLRALYQTRTPS
jgi:hypothetical protein